MPPRVGYTTRQLERMLQAEVGANPLALARAQRTQTARVLIETTDLPFSDVAFAAGFSSIRQFNDTIRTVCDLTPTALRERAQAKFGRGEAVAAGTLSLRLPVRTPFAYEGLFGHLAACAVPGVEEVRDGAYRRTLRLPAGNGIVSLTPEPDHVRCMLVLDDFRDLATAIARCRRLLDLDADPEAVVDALGADPDLSALVAKAPGQRIPRTVDEPELALRVVLGQQVSVKAARTHAARIVSAYGQPVTDTDGGLTHVFPAVEHLAEIDPGASGLPQVAAAISDRARRGVGRRRRPAGCRLRLEPRPAAAVGIAGDRTLDRGSDRDAWPGRPRRISGHRPRCSAGRQAGRAAGGFPRPHRAQRSMATVAVVCRPTPLDRTRPRGESLASEGEVMSAIQFRTVDSPVGPLTLAGRGGRLMHLRMVDQTYEPSHDGWER